jgi:peptidoglycan/LPS O-acetylase OafA/YrhL
MWTHEVEWKIAGHSFRKLQNIGGLGVTLFFAISGILITTRILEEESICGFFDIKKFYIRRIFRIQPAAWLYLAVVAILIASGSIAMLWRHWFAALGMYENFLYQGPAFDYQGFFVGHFWSLAVEEHFYILLSLFLLLVKRNRLPILVCVFIALYFFRDYATDHGVFTAATERRTYYQLPVLVYGACFAVALRKQAWRSLAERYLQPWVAFAVSAVVFFGKPVVHHMLWRTPFDIYPSAFVSMFGFLSVFMFAVWIVSTMLHPNSLSTRILELRPMRWVGRLSYSLYLWHVLFFFRVLPTVHVSLPLLLALSGRPAKFIAAFSMAALSYYLVEKPCMRLGHRLAPPATPGRPELVEGPAT